MWLELMWLELMWLELMWLIDFYNKQHFLIYFPLCVGTLKEVQGIGIDFYIFNVARVNGL